MILDVTFQEVSQGFSVGFGTPTPQPCGVLYTPQSLNEEQKAQARENIGALQVDDNTVGADAWSSKNIVDKFGMVASASGETICLTDCFPLSAPIKGLKVSIMATQQGEGTPSAENVRPIIPFEMSMVTVGVDRTEDMPNPTLYSSGTLPENTYGGYVDWNRGVFVQTHEYAVVDGTKGTIVVQGNGNFYINNSLDYYKPSQVSAGSLQNTGMCDSFVYGKGNGSRVAFASATNTFFNGVTECTTSSELKAYLQEHPAHIVYPLQTPIEHPLADMPNTEILLAEAPCYISSDGSNLEVMYVADTKAYIDKKFTELQNAIISLCGKV